MGLVGLAGITGLASLLLDQWLHVPSWLPRHELLQVAQPDNCNCLIVCYLMCKSKSNWRFKLQAASLHLAKPD